MQSQHNYHIMILYILLTVIGMFSGSVLRYEHYIRPFCEEVLITWVVLSICGLIFTNMIPVFYLMNMVTIGWLACDYVEDFVNRN